MILSSLPHPFMSTHSVYAKVVVQVFFTYEELEEVKMLASLDGGSLTADEAIHALASEKIESEEAKIRDLVVDMATLK